MKRNHVYHLVPQSAWLACQAGSYYRPQRLERDGFIHCCGDPSILAQLADDYFADLNETLLLLIIARTRLESPLRFEAPALIEGGGRAHLNQGHLFPHLYGPLNLDAVVEVATMPRSGGCYRLPERSLPECEE